MGSRRIRSSASSSPIGATAPPYESLRSRKMLSISATDYPPKPTASPQKRCPQRYEPSRTHPPRSARTIRQIRPPRLTPSPLIFQLPELVPRKLRGHDGPTINAAVRSLTSRRAGANPVRARVMAPRTRCHLSNRCSAGIRHCGPGPTMAQRMRHPLNVVWPAELSRSILHQGEHLFVPPHRRREQKGAS